MGPYDHVVRAAMISTPTYVVPAHTLRTTRFDKGLAALAARTKAPPLALSVRVDLIKSRVSSVDLRMNVTDLRIN